MNFDLDQRRAKMGVGELSDFSVGPRDPGEGRTGIWRAHLGAEWHRRLAAEAASADPAAQFEVAIEGSIQLRGWTLVLSGRIDQWVRGGPRPVLREIKTVARELPADEAFLRSEYPAYFIQLAAYHALLGASAPPAAQLVFVEFESGLSQTVALAPEDTARFHARLAAVVEFLELRLRARQHRMTLRFRSPFPALRAGQEQIREALASAAAGEPSAVLLEAPTGFGKTGVLLEFALSQLKTGHFDRAIYLTSKSTGQLQVMRTLSSMAPERAPGAGPVPIPAWHVRNKGEHCIHSVFHCVRGVCPYLEDVEARWPRSGLSRFQLFEGQANDIATLRGAGRDAAICPYEITRASLAFNDLWIGDYNYVFAPANRGLFFNQPGFQPERTLLLVDEAHNLPSRVAGAYSHAFSQAPAHAVAAALDETGAPSSLVGAWDGWRRFLSALPPSDALEPDAVDEAKRWMAEIGRLVSTLPLDFGAMGPAAAEQLWRMPSVASEVEEVDLPRLWWSPAAGELALTCLDAAAAIGASLREFGGVVLATATPGPEELFSEACGVPLRPVPARTPWRSGAYDVAVDLRVDTTYQRRSTHYATTASAVRSLCEASSAASGRRAIAVFFPSYAYAEAIAGELQREAPALRAALQPRLQDLSGQAAWVDRSLADSDALFLVLGSSFSESIDVLGGRVTHAMVVGPALPEVNAVQRARLASLESLGRDEAFHRVYRVPGLLKVNQALGRLVRAPGQRAKVLLHCRRFAEPGYAGLLAEDYREALGIRSQAGLEEWLAANPVEAA